MWLDRDHTVVTLTQEGRDLLESRRMRCTQADTRVALRDKQPVWLTVETIDEPERDRGAAICAAEGRHREHALLLGGRAPQPRVIA